MSTALFAEIAERKSHLAASLLAARARYFGLLNTPATMGSLAEGLGFPDDIRCYYQGGAAETAAIGSCIQLLCGVSPLVQKQPVRFAKHKILAVLDGLGLQFSRIDALIKFTKSHLEKETLVDLTSEEFAEVLESRFKGFGELASSSL